MPVCPSPAGTLRPPPARNLRSATHLESALVHEQARERIYRLAFYDELTGLPNRSKFTDLLSKNIELGLPFALVLVDIDHLKIVNDTVGHSFGDMLIRTVAERIANSDPQLIACPLGGDEFAVLIEGCEPGERPEAGDPQKPDLQAR